MMIETGRTDSATHLPAADINQQLQGYPQAHFPGSIVVVDTPKGLAQVIPEIREQELLGFDTESRPSFKKGEYYNTALLQLATHQKAWLLRLCRIGLTEEILQLLSSPKIVKVGVALHDDIARLQRIVPFTPAGFLDLQTSAKVLGIQEQSVRKLAAAVLRLRVSKTAQLTNWEQPQLTPAQLVYAATDAWVCLKLFQTQPFCGYYAERGGR